MDTKEPPLLMLLVRQDIIFEYKMRVGKRDLPTYGG